MDQSNIFVFSLLGLNIIQFIFWSRQVQRLIDKLMSRNYAEYIASNKTGPIEHKFENQDEIVSEDAVLNEVNSLLGGG